MIKIEISNNEYSVASPTLAVWLISTISKNSINNIAPYGMVMPVSYQPLIVAVGTDVNRDTYKNIIQTGEFVLNLASTQMIKKVNITAAKFPPEIDEFEKADLTSLPSLKVKPGRIEECKVHIECQLKDNFEITETRRIITANSLAITIDKNISKRIVRSNFLCKRQLFWSGQICRKKIITIMSRFQKDVSHEFTNFH